jgi:hypothetical protein
LIRRRHFRDHATPAAAGGGLRRRPRTDGVAAVLGSALAHGRQRDEALWFGPGLMLALGELAARYGDAAGLGIHQGPESVRYLWLDRARRAAA